MKTLMELNLIQYFSKFHPTDFKVRSCENTQHCLNQYSALIRDMTDVEKAALQPLIVKANYALGPFEKLKSIPWKFKVFPSNIIENGYPHTHQDTIFLPDDFFHNTAGKDHTLIHEKIHVYQRIYPLQTHQLLCDTWKFTIIGFIGSDNENTRNNKTTRRTNPDSNMLLYALNGKPVGGYYRPDALTLADIDYSHTYDEIPSHQRDHPFEVMACILTSIITKQEYPDSNNIWVSKAKLWMSMNL